MELPVAWCSAPVGVYLLRNGLSPRFGTEIEIPKSEARPSLPLDRYSGSEALGQPLCMFSGQNLVSRVPSKFVWHTSMNEKVPAIIQENHDPQSARPDPRRRPAQKVDQARLHERTTSDSLVVRVTLKDGQVGYGEGVPRPYVTGETITSTFASLSEFDFTQHLGKPTSFENVVRRLESLVLPETEADPRGMAGNAARCALELALLDAYGRRFDRSIGQAVRIADIPGLNGPTFPPGFVTVGRSWRNRRSMQQISAWKMWLYGFKQVKLKVGVLGQDDPARLARLRQILGRRIDLRLDANEAWHSGELVEQVRPLLRFGPSVLEQPVPHAEADSLTELRPKLGMPIMLDESLCGYPDATRAIGARDC